VRLGLMTMLVGLLLAVAVPAGARPLAGSESESCRDSSCHDEQWCEGNGREGNESGNRGDSRHCRDDSTHEGSDRQGQSGQPDPDDEPVLDQHDRRTVSQRVGDRCQDEASTSASAGGVDIQADHDHECASLERAARKLDRYVRIDGRVITVTLGQVSIGIDTRT